MTLANVAKTPVAAFPEAAATVPSASQVFDELMGELTVTRAV